MQSGPNLAPPPWRASHFPCAAGTVRLVRSIHAEITEMGLSDRQQLNKLDTAARKHLENPDVLVMPALNFLAWGRKPRASS